MLDELNVGIAKLAQALLQVLAEAAQGHLDDIHVAKQLPVQGAAETDQPGGHGRGRVVTCAQLWGRQNHCPYSLDRRRGIRRKFKMPACAGHHVEL